MTGTQTIDIPVDLYDSPQEFVVVMPLWGVTKKSVQLTLDETWVLTIKGKRKQPDMKASLSATAQTCFWGEFTKTIKLPENSYFNKIHSELSKENILTVVVPKVIVPEEIAVHVQ